MTLKQNTVAVNALANLLYDCVVIVCFQMVCNVSSTRFRRVEACRWACLSWTNNQITLISRPGHRSTRFDWLALVLAYDLIGWRFRRRLKSWTFLNFQSEQRRQSDTMHFGKAWRHPIQSEWEASPLKHAMLPCGRAIEMGGLDIASLNTPQGFRGMAQSN